MKRLTSLMAVVLCLCLAASTAYAYSRYDLQRANRTRDRGDFFEARRQYSAIARDYYTEQHLRRQAGYFLGFCSVRLNEPYNAISDYRWFLREFDNGNTTLIPDALYVLGRTYETIDNVRDAKWCYRECIRRFSYGEFPQKSRERLNYLEGGYDNGGYTHGGYGPYYSMEAAPATEAASAAPSRALSATDPFDGFQMDLQSDKVEALKATFDKLHERP